MLHHPEPQVGNRSFPTMPTFCRALLTRTVRADRLGRGELIADGIVHAVGIVFALVAGIALLLSAFFQTTAAEFVALTFYVGSLIAVFSISCAYNLWPATPLKHVLRRADHAAIYLLIAGTYTPFLTQLPSSGVALALIIFIWVATAFGIALKVLLPGRFDRVAVASYLLIGWSGILVLEPLSVALPATAIKLMLAGGLIYSLGVFFFAWRALKYQTALWHAFVVSGAVLHFIAVADTMMFTRLA